MKNINENRRKISNEHGLLPKFVIETVEDLRLKSFDPTDLVIDTNKTNTIYQSLTIPIKSYLDSAYINSNIAYSNYTINKKSIPDRDGFFIGVI